LSGSEKEGHAIELKDGIFDGGGGNRRGKKGVERGKEEELVWNSGVKTVKCGERAKGRVKQGSGGGRFEM